MEINHKIIIYTNVVSKVYILFNKCFNLLPKFKTFHNKTIIRNINFEIDKTFINYFHILSKIN